MIRMVEPKNETNFIKIFGKGFHSSVYMILIDSVEMRFHLFQLFPSRGC